MTAQELEQRLSAISDTLAGIARSQQSMLASQARLLTAIDGLGVPRGTGPVPPTVVIRKVAGPKPLTKVALDVARGLVQPFSYSELRLRMSTRHPRRMRSVSSSSVSAAVSRLIDEGLLYRDPEAKYYPRAKGYRVTQKGLTE